MTKVIAETRAAGAVSILPCALVRLADTHLETWQWSAAAACPHEADRLAQETGQPADQGAHLVVFPEAFVPGPPVWIDALPIAMMLIGPQC
jgi:hypothetical protein